LNGPYVQKRREKCVVFLDDGFDSEETPRRLLAESFYKVESFIAHFKRPADGGKEERVKDPRILRLCNRHKWLLVTTDSDIRFTHIEEIKLCQDLAILATAHNNVDDIDEWVGGLIIARPRIEREFKKRSRPWYAQFNRQGAITTIYTVTDRHATRRNRPREKDAI
jgi:hypothetical protein